jgi:hypothetical protein
MNPNYGTIHNLHEGSAALLALTCTGEPLLSIIVDDTLSGQDYLVVHKDGVMRIYIAEGVRPCDICIVTDDRTEKLRLEKQSRFNYNEVINRVFIEVGDIFSIHYAVNTGNYSIHANRGG